MHPRLNEQVFDMKTIENKLTEWLLQIGVAEGDVTLALNIAAFIFIIAVAVIAHKLCKRFIVPAVRKITDKTQSVWDDHLLNDTVLKNLCGLIPPIIIYMLVPVPLSDDPDTLRVILKFCSIYITIAAIQLACSVISAIYTISSEHEKLKNHSLKAFYQTLKLIVVCIGIIIVISTLIDKNPAIILTGLGAGAAILMLIFQDTIKALVAGIQLMTNDMLRPGDWITMPKYNADGDVMEITLTTVKVRNWDKTITTIPPYALVNDSFQNWRGMFDIGGRRVKRSINIDMQTVRFCTAAELENFKKQPWMEGFEETGKEEVNLYIFRHYMEYYLKHHPKVSQELIITVRQLQPTAQGLPVELYFFSADTRWLKYEHLQAEVFDHVLAMLHTFDLKVFQSPTGGDIQKFS